MQDAVGEEQQGHVFHHGAVPHALQVSLFQVTVEPGVGNGHHEEAERIQQDEGHHVAGSTRLPEGQRQADHSFIVLQEVSHRG